MMRISRHRQILCSVWIASCVGIGTLLAAEHAMVILEDGERISGTVIARGGARGRGGASRGALNLLTDDGRDVGIPLDRAAVIQFGGGEPSPSELAALPHDNTHMMVRRNGVRESGEFIAVVGDDMVRWQARNGREQMIPFRELTRIYLNAGRVRAAFDGPGRYNPGFRDGRDAHGGGRDDRGFPNGDDRGVRSNEPGFGNGNEPGSRNGNNRTGAGAGAGVGRDVRVEANQWTNSGLNVKAGDLVTFRASGRINFGQGQTQNAGPEGNDSLKRAEYPVSGAPVGALIGRVGNSAPFLIGANAQPIRMPANGTLMLGVNDNEVGDNSGVFTVAIARQ